MFFCLALILKLITIHTVTATTMLDCALGLTPNSQCPVNGGWSLWSLWGACEGECGSVGRQLRFRNCSNPPPSRGGEPCQGDQLEVKQCVIAGCSFERYQKQVVGDPLRETQLLALKQLAGSQHALLAKCLSSSCHFSTILQALDQNANRFWNALQCVKKNTGCPVAGGWGEWSAWSRCSARCGSGRQARCRVCCNPPPSSPELSCSGDSCQFQECTATDCGSANTLHPDGVWSEWSEWSNCSAPCSLGISRRYRVCKKESNRKRKNSINFKTTDNFHDGGIYENYYYELGDDWTRVKRSNVNLNSANYYQLPNKNKCLVTATTSGVSQLTYDLEESEEDCTLISEQQKKENVQQDEDEYDEEEEEEEGDSDINIILENFQETSFPSSFSETIPYSLTTFTGKGEPSNIPENDGEDDDGNDAKCTGGLYKNEKSKKPPPVPLVSSTNNLESTILKDEGCTKPFQSEITYASKVASTDGTPTPKELEEMYTNSPNFMGNKNSSYSKITLSTNPCGNFNTTIRTKNFKSTKASSRDLAVPFQISTMSTEGSFENSDGYKNLSTSISLSSVTLVESPKDSADKQSKEKTKSTTIFEIKNLKTISSTALKPTSKNHYKTNTSEQDDSYKSSSDGKNDEYVTSLSLKSTTANPVQVPTLNTESSCENDAKYKLLTTRTSFSPVKFIESPTNSANKQSNEKTVSYSTTFPTSIENYHTIPNDQNGSYNSTPDKQDDKDVTSLSLFPSLDPVISSQSPSKLKQNNSFPETYEVTSSHTFITTVILKDTTVPVPRSYRSSPVFSTFTKKQPSSLTSISSLASTYKVNNSESHNSSDDNDNFITENPSDVFNIKHCDLESILDLPSYEGSFKGAMCKGQFEEIKVCDTEPCTGDGGWSSWAAWSACSTECGVGAQDTTRACSSPEPSGMGAPCPGEPTLTRTCFLQPCPLRVVTARALLSEAVHFEPTQVPVSVLLIFLRFRFFAGQDQRLLLLRSSSNGDIIRLSLYGGCVLFSVKEQKCHADVLSNQILTVGDWHSILVTVVGAVVTLQVDDSVLPQTSQLSCRPVFPDYDAHMTLGGAQGLSGEVEFISVNYHNYGLLNTPAAPSTRRTRQVEQNRHQQEMASEELLTQSLSYLLMAPCYLNHSDWGMKLALKPELTDGLVLFIRGSGRNEYMFVSLEQSRVRLRVQQSSAAGECEVAGEVAARAWLQFEITRPPEGPVGLSVNGGSRCIISLATGDDKEEPPVACRGDILLGQMPSSVKSMLLSDGNHSIPLHSPQGLLGSLSVDNHSLDLSRLPFRVPPDLTEIYPSNQYRFSSLTASSSVYYEERLVLPNEPISMACVYDLSEDKLNENLYSLNNDIDSPEYSASWIKLDLPVEVAFGNGSSVKYEVSDNGKSISLNISTYKHIAEVEGFYSCWLHHPLPLTPGLNIVTYSIVITPEQEERRVLSILIIVHLVLSMLLVIFFIIWLIYEAVFDFRKGCGFYRSEKINSEEFHNRIHHLMFTDKGIKMLGGLDSAHRAYARFLEASATPDSRPGLEEAEKLEETHPDLEFDDKDYDYDDNSLPTNRRSDLAQGAPVGFVKIQSNSTFLSKKRINSNEKRKKGSELQRHKNRNEVNLNVGSRLRAGDNLVDVWDGWHPKEIKTQTQTPPVIGHIQNTPAFRSIRDELKFKPEKFKELKKYHDCNKST